MLAVSFYGTVFGTQAVLPVMKKQGSGHIVNMSSVVGRKAFPGFGAYSVAMHAISAFSDALRQELNGSNISVTTVHPALTQTAMLDAVNPIDMPSPFHAMTPLTPAYVAAGILGAVYKRQPRVILPVPPRVMLLADALSPRIGDLIVRLLSKPLTSALIGMYRGRVYEHHPASNSGTAADA
jgi:short-subunit dehydrogenase